MDTSHPQDDFSSRFFIWHEWIQAHGPLTPQNALDYFATSMFYDKQSNNQVLRMQTMHTGMPLENEAEELKRFTGVEFGLVYEEAPTLFVIHKRDRLSPDEVRPLAAYFIMHNRIYQAPDLYNVVSNRLLASVIALQASLGTLLSHKPDFTPRTGFLWPITHSRSATQGPNPKKLEGVGNEFPVIDDASLPVKRRNATTFKKQEDFTLLYNAMRTTAAQVQQTPGSRISNTTATLTDSQATQSHLSETPGPSSVPPSGLTPQSEDGSAKLLPGAGKKKKKRELR
ncbi:MED6-domain-containing protein [Hysterangium stoloniferum]|nr:MED6-domain-containing protein [Hysterangium stoloniferum]